MNMIKNIYKFRLLSDSFYFKVVFMIWALIHSFSFGSYVTGYISPIMILWGALLLFRNFVLEKKSVKKSYVYIMLAFLASYVVTIIYNRQLNLVGNTKTLIWSAIMLFVIFLNEVKSDNKKLYKDIEKISFILAILIFIISLISIGMFCFDVSYWINRSDGTAIPQGFYAARLWGFYVDPNQACTTGIISLVASVILLVNKKKYKIGVTIFNIVNIVIQYIFIILTGSRGGEISLVFVLIGFIYLLVDYLLKDKVRGDLGRKVISMVLGFIIAISLVFTFDGTRSLLANIPRLTVRTQQIISDTTGVEIGKNEGNITVERPDIGGDADLSNGRLTLWTDGFRLIKYSPIFGFGDRNIFIKAGELTPGSSLETQYVHNGFIHMLLSGGIVAVAIMMLLLILIMIDIIKVVFGISKYNTKYYIYSIMSLMVGALLITAMFLTEIFYQNSFIATIFWIYLGFIVAIDKNELVEVN